MLLETKDIYLDKGKFEDWEDMYRNIWSRAESARYMLWRVSRGFLRTPASLSARSTWGRDMESSFFPRLWHIALRSGEGRNLSAPAVQKIRRPRDLLCPAALPIPTLRIGWMPATVKAMWWNFLRSAGNDIDMFQNMTAGFCPAVFNDYW